MKISTKVKAGAASWKQLSTKYYRHIPTSTVILNNRINPLQGITSQQRYHTQLFQSSVIVTAKIIAFNIDETVSQDQLNLLFNDTRNMGGAASVKAGEDIANTIARAHPMFPEVNDPKVTNMFMNYTKKEGLKRIFCAEPGQERLSKILSHDLRSHVSHAHLLVKLTENTTSTQHLPTSLILLLRFSSTERRHFRIS
jgi:hypothetical protein